MKLKHEDNKKLIFSSNTQSCTRSVTTTASRTCPGRQHPAKYYPSASAGVIRAIGHHSAANGNVQPAHRQHQPNKSTSGGTAAGRSRADSPSGTRFVTREPGPSTRNPAAGPFAGKQSHQHQPLLQHYRTAGDTVAAAVGASPADRNRPPSSAESPRWREPVPVAPQRPHRNRAKFRPDLCPTEREPGRGRRHLQ